MKYVYTFPLSIDTCRAIKSVGEMMSNVNEFMGQCGFQEKVVLRSEVGQTTVTSENKLMPHELSKLKDILQETLNKTGLDKSGLLEFFVGEPTVTTALRGELEAMK